MNHPSVKLGFASVVKDEISTGIWMIAPGAHYVIMAGARLSALPLLLVGVNTIRRSGSPVRTAEPFYTRHLNEMGNFDDPATLAELSSPGI